MRTGRLEAFSDGVLAVAITLLVFNLKVPGVGTGDLGRELAARWPSYLAYAISFASIGIMWVNHHTLFDGVRHVDRTLLFANLMLLLCIVTLPFTTALAATWIRAPHGRELAAIVFGCNLWAISFGFLLLRWYLGRHDHLLRPGFRHAPRDALRRSAVGPVSYGAATLLALVEPVVAVALYGAIAAYFVLPANLRAVDGADEPTDR